MDEIVCANTAFRYWRCQPGCATFIRAYPTPKKAGEP